MQVNPVVLKELKVKMRGWKSPALVTSYIVFLTLVIFLFFLVNNQIIYTRYASFSPRIAIEAYNALAVVQFGLIILIAPVLTAGAISGEKERQTLDLMLCTSLSSYAIAGGKLFVSLAHILMLVTASLPVMGIVFLYGGVGLGDLLLVFAFYLVVAYMAGSMGIFFSTVFRKSSTSMIMSYLSLGAMMFGTIICILIWGYLTIAITGNEPDPKYMPYFLIPNPAFGFMSSMESTGSPGSIFWIIRDLRHFTSSMQAGFLVSRPWLTNMIFNAVTGTVFLMLAAWRVNPMRRGLITLIKDKRNRNTQSKPEKTEQAKIRQSECR